MPATLDANDLVEFDQATLLLDGTYGHLRTQKDDLHHARTGRHRTRTPWEPIQAPVAREGVPTVGLFVRPAQAMPGVLRHSVDEPFAEIGAHVWGWLGGSVVERLSECQDDRALCDGDSVAAVANHPSQPRPDSGGLVSAEDDLGGVGPVEHVGDERVADFTVRR